MSKIREMFEALINDPEMKNNPKFKESEKFGKALDELMARKAEEKKNGGVSFDRKKEIILAIADPDMSVDDIIGKFFKKDMTDEQRKMVADHIAKVRVEQADRLQRIREHANED